MEDYILQRVNHPETRYHLNIMLSGKEKLTIGRKQRSARSATLIDIICSRTTISQPHCELEFHDSQWFVKDLDSTNGVFVNGIRIPKQEAFRINVGDVLGIGAADNSDVNFLFDILKNVVKNEIPDASSLELEQATAGPSLKKPAEEVVGVASNALAKKPEDSTPSKSKSTKNSTTKKAQEEATLEVKISTTDIATPIGSNKLLVTELPQSLIKTTVMESVYREKMHKEKSTQTSTFESNKETSPLSKPSTSSSKSSYCPSEEAKPPITDNEIKNKIYERNKDPKLAPKVDCQVIIEAIKDGREKTDKNKPRPKQSSTYTSAEAKKRPSTTQIDQSNLRKKLKVNIENVASNPVFLLGRQPPDGTNRTNHPRHPDGSSTIVTELTPQIIDSEPDVTTVKELRQSPDLPTSRGILSKGSSPNRGRRISFKESDTSVLKNPAQPDSFYEVLTAVKRIPHRLDSENQWSIEGTVVRAADNIVNHPNANLIDELKLRVLNWNFSWIVEQEKPEMANMMVPILHELTSIEDKSVICPKLCVRPIVTNHTNIANLPNIFAPLLLHEAWVAIGRGSEANVRLPLVFQVLVKDTAQPSSGRLTKHENVLNCQCILQSTQQLVEFDLLILSMPDHQSKSPFGMVIGSCRLEHLNEETRRTLDFRLVEATEEGFGRPLAYGSDLILFFQLQVRKGFSLDSLDKIYSVTKVASLRAMLLKRLSLNDELVNSPLGGIIMEPSKHASAFTMIPYTPHPQRPFGQLNSTQYSAVHSIAQTITQSPEPKIAVIQGAPGTGKTHVLVESTAEMINLVAKTGMKPRIMVCSPSRSSVVQITDRLLKKFPPNPVKVLFIGDANGNAKLESISLRVKAKQLWKAAALRYPSEHSDYMRSASNDRERLKARKLTILAEMREAQRAGNSGKANSCGRDLKEFERKIEDLSQGIYQTEQEHYVFCQRPDIRNKIGNHFQELAVCQADIICTTLEWSRNLYHRELHKIFIAKESQQPGADRPFSCCIIDDASECAESEILFVLGFGFRKLVLAGDLMVNKSKNSRSNHQDIVFDNSIFNRLHNYLTMLHPGEKALFVLNTQYRMTFPVSDWISRTFYGGLLLSATIRARNCPLNPLIVLNVANGVEILHTPRFGSGISNPSEANLIAKMILFLTKLPALKTKAFGIVAFSSTQKHEIIHRMQRCGSLENVKVDTIDNFQGEEKDVLIVSCGRARKEPGNLGLLASHHLIKIALSRARDSLIVCGQSNSLETCEHWKSLIDHSKATGSFHVVSDTFTQAMLRNVLMR